MKNLIIVCLIISASLLSCKKEKDTITQHDIKGMVYNNCTDSGLANVTVYLKDGQGLNLNTVSDASGNFVFPAVNIHSHSKYIYNIYIPSKSGTNATTFEYCGFDGTRMYFNHDEADLFLKPRVKPFYLFFTVYCDKNPLTTKNDSIIFYSVIIPFIKMHPMTFTVGGAGGMAIVNTLIMGGVILWENI